MHLTSISPETRRIAPECPISPTASHWKWTFPHFPPANNGSKKRKSGDNTYQTPEVTQLWSIGTWWLGNSVRRPPERSKRKSVRSGGAASGCLRSCASVLLTTRKSCDQLGEARTQLQRATLVRTSDPFRDLNGCFWRLRRARKTLTR